MRCVFHGLSGDLPVVQRRSHPFEMGKNDDSRPSVATRSGANRVKRKGYPTGDGIRLESGRAISLAGSTPAPSARPDLRVGRSDGVRGVAEACETVNLKEPGSTPAEHLKGRSHSPDRGVLLGGQRASKTRAQHRVRILAPLLKPSRRALAEPGMCLCWDRCLHVMGP